MKREIPVRELKVRTATNGRVPLGRTTLLRDVYRSLINTGRTYAAFRESDQATVARLVKKAPILDPMSGYGGLAAFCAELGVESVGVEYNPPQFYWQLLVHPKRSEMHLNAIEAILRKRRSWPRPRALAVVADDFFPVETRLLLERIFTLLTNVCSDVPSRGSIDPWQMAISLILPFCGRLACTSPGDVSTHTKEGGTCVLTGWQDDFQTYLNALRNRIELIRSRTKCITHEVILGDARSVDLGKRRFSAMFTSPPYPNHRDFSSILLPENTFLRTIGDACGFTIPFAREGIIGSNFVKGEQTRQPHSSVANVFLRNAMTIKRSKNAEYDDNVYYLPYFNKYFSALEEAYTNISRYLDATFEGYVIVVNNTHRGLVIPVSETIQDIWRSLGFQAEVFDSRETFHFGTKNPRAKGIRARHTEYVVKIWR